MLSPTSSTWASIRDSSNAQNASYHLLRLRQQLEPATDQRIEQTQHVCEVSIQLVGNQRDRWAPATTLPHHTTTNIFCCPEADEEIIQLELKTAPSVVQQNVLLPKNTL